MTASVVTLMEFETPLERMEHRVSRVMLCSSVILTLESGWPVFTNVDRSMQRGARDMHQQRIMMLQFSLVANYC